ncbi:hypothetical protein ACFLZX_06085 [Nanoarchaeota archaeon]
MKIFFIFLIFVLLVSCSTEDPFVNPIPGNNSCNGTTCDTNNLELDGLFSSDEDINPPPIPN